MECSVSTLGRTKYLFITNTKNNTNITKTEEPDILCVRYDVPEKGQIEILVDLKNPKLQGIALPNVKIGKKEHVVMSTNTLLISADDVDSFCESNY